jgi:hypothetical protein
MYRGRTGVGGEALAVTPSWCTPRYGTGTRGARRGALICMYGTGDTDRVKSFPHNFTSIPMYLRLSRERMERPYNRSFLLAPKGDSFYNRNSYVPLFLSGWKLWWFFVATIWAFLQAYSTLRIKISGSSSELGHPEAAHGFRFFQQPVSIRTNMVCVWTVPKASNRRLAWSEITDDDPHDLRHSTKVRLFNGFFQRDFERIEQIVNNWECCPENANVAIFGYFCGGFGGKEPQP